MRRYTALGPNHSDSAPLAPVRPPRPCPPRHPARLLPDAGLPAAPAIGGYWTRTNDVEIDIVGADRAPIAKELHVILLGRGRMSADYRPGHGADARRAGRVRVVRGLRVTSAWAARPAPVTDNQVRPAQGLLDPMRSLDPHS